MKSNPRRPTIKAALESAEEPMLTRTITARMRQSNELSWIARQSAEAAQVDNHNGLIAVVFSALYFEAVVNELLDHLGQIDSTASDQLSRAKVVAEAARLDARNVSIETRVKVLVSAETGKLVDFGDKEFRHLDLLISLRNHIVHTKPEVLVIRENLAPEGRSLVTDNHHKLLKTIFSLKVWPKPTKPDLLYVTKAVRDPSVAKWAYNTAHTSLAALAKYLPPWKPPIGDPKLFVL